MLTQLQVRLRIDTITNRQIKFEFHYAAVVYGFVLSLNPDSNNIAGH